MGTWGTGAFQNDEAQEWCYELAERGLAVVVAALREASTAIEVDVEEGNGGGGVRFSASAAIRSLAAAEVVAAAIGRPNRDDLPDEVHEFLDSDPLIGSELVDMAHRAVRRSLRKGSQLRRLWEDDPEWMTATEALLSRLAVRVPG